MWVILGCADCEFAIIYMESNGAVSMKTLIIAEAGANHNGKIEIAFQLIDEAKKAGADIVKFQTGIPEKVTSRYAHMAEYQKKNIGTNESQLNMIRKISLSYSDYKGISFLSTPFDLESITFLDNLGCNIWKIPSGEITNYPYLVRIAKTRKPIILSTGMSTITEIRDAIDLLLSKGTTDIKLLHCTTEYPAPFEEVNLRAIETLKQRFGYEVGYSDHTVGIEISIAAVVMGATIIEKHFTLDRNMEGPDHKASIEPNELAEMIRSIRNVEKAIGDGRKIPTKSEEKNIPIARKSIIAACRIIKGEILSEVNLTTKRPGSGINPMRWNEVIGTKAIRDFDEDELIEL